MNTEILRHVLNTKTAAATRDISSLVRSLGGKARGTGRAALDKLRAGTRRGVDIAKGPVGLAGLAGAGAIGASHLFSTPEVPQEPSMLERVGTWSRDNPWSAGALAGGAGLLGGYGVMSALRGKDEDEED